MKILGLDPGTAQSAYVIYDTESKNIFAHAVVNNESLVDNIKNGALGMMFNLMAVEMIESRGMPVGKETHETTYWIGRFCQATSRRFVRIYRREIKIHLCGTVRAQDANIRQALIDRFGAVGTKKQPGVLYGIKSHEWAALAVAIYAGDKNHA